MVQGGEGEGRRGRVKMGIPREGREMGREKGRPSGEMSERASASESLT